MSTQLALSIGDSIISAQKSGLRVNLEFSDEQEPRKRARLLYAFRLFCAVYGHRPVASPSDAEICLSYSTASSFADRSIRLSSLYECRPLSAPAPAPVWYSADGLTTSLFFGPEPGEEPDWLGEIFEWVSCADEYSLVPRGSEGKPRTEDYYVFRHGLDPYIPYAALAMWFLQRAINRVARAGSQPESPIIDKHLVAVTHDVDYMPKDRWSNALRILRNAAAALIVHKRVLLSFRLGLRGLLTAAGGPNPLDQIPELARGERSRGISATYFFIARRAHRHDANYNLGDPLVSGSIRSLDEQRMEIGVHGSYCSLDQPVSLPSEFDAVRKLGCTPLGNRQHWLRFRLNDLIPALEEAGATYDSSIGWSDSLGFRAGASFPFPPYHFAEERAAKFLEIPLVMMDVALAFGQSRMSESEWRKSISQVLSNSRRFGWGGIAILWHPTGFGGGQIPSRIGELFWELADNRMRVGDKWMSGGQLVNAVLPRYQEAGFTELN